MDFPFKSLDTFTKVTVLPLLLTVVSKVPSIKLRPAPPSFRIVKEAVPFI